MSEQKSIFSSPAVRPGVFASLLALIALSGCDTAPGPASTLPPTAEPTDGAGSAETLTLHQIYEQNCAGCHGTELDGGQGPSLIDDEWKHGSSDEAIEKVISAGVPAAGMPPFGSTLTQEELRGLVVYIREAASDYTAGEHAAAKALPKDPVVTRKATFDVRLVAENLETPWSMIWLDRNTLLVSIREGKLLKIDIRTGMKRLIDGAPVITEQFIHGGMLGLEIDPDFPRNGWIYLAYTDEAPASANPQTIRDCDGQKGCFEKISQLQIMRARVRDDHLVDQQIIWSAPKSTYRATPNVGGRMAFGPDGMLYFSVGDRLYRPDEAQMLSLPNGKIHRIAPDGRVPQDNPFYGRKGLIGSIWSYGHRNPQGLAFDPALGQLWSTEHGPRGGDELNLIRKAGNYGWPFVTLGMGYDGRAFDPHYPIGRDNPGVKAVPLPIKAQFDRNTAQSPVQNWTPSIAISDLLFVRSTKFGGWNGELLVGSLRQQRLLRLHVVENQVTSEELILEGFGDIRDISTAPDGTIYLALNRPGRIIQLSPR